MTTEKRAKEALSLLRHEDNQASETGIEVTIRGLAVTPSGPNEGPEIYLQVTPTLVLHEVEVGWTKGTKVRKAGLIQRTSNPPCQWIVMQVSQDFLRTLRLESPKQTPLSAWVFSRSSSKSVIDLASRAMKRGLEEKGSILGYLLDYSNCCDFSPRASFFPEKLPGLNGQLNEYQLQAFMTLVQHKASLVQGLPGSGKSRLMVEIAKICDELNLRVLMTAETNVSCENLVEKLVDIGLSPVWDRSETAGSPRNKGLIQYTLDHIVKTSTWSRRPAITEAHILVQTTSKATFSPTDRVNHVLFIDEGGLIPAYRWPALRLIKANSVLICGDQAQNQPYKEVEGEFSILMEKHPSLTSVLRIQYRMPPSIAQLPSTISYHGKMESARMDPVLPEALHPRLAFHLVFINNPQKISHLMKRGNSSINHSQLNTILALLVILKQCYAASRIQIISPYDAQVQELESAVRTAHPDVPTPLTVTRAQGMEFDVVILCLVKSDGFSSKREIVNVGSSRAKVQQFILGDSVTMRQTEVWKISHPVWHHHFIDCKEVHTIATGILAPVNGGLRHQD